ncbi:hypothetical protein GYB22_12340 [bacterium]|nr:hypothetical protein [bacterium]
MDTKLTLKLNQSVIENAKKYAAEKNISLSRLIEAYLKALTSSEKNAEFEISPFVKSIATGKSVPSEINAKKEYSDHLMDKYE